MVIEERERDRKREFYLVYHILQPKRWELNRGHGYISIFCWVSLYYKINTLRGVEAYCISTKGFLFAHSNAWIGIAWRKILKSFVSLISWRIFNNIEWQKNLDDIQMNFQMRWKDEHWLHLLRQQITLLTVKK